MRKSRRKSSYRSKRPSKQSEGCNSANINKYKKIIEFQKINCLGNITSNGEVILHKDPYNIDEFNDLMCIIGKHKPIASILVWKGKLADISNSSKMILFSLLKLAEKCKIYAFLEELNNKMYTMLVYHQKDFKKAVIGAYLVKNQLGNSYVYGKIFGYTEKNIKIFYKTKETIEKYYDDKKNYRYLIDKTINSTDFERFFRNAQEKQEILPAEDIYTFVTKQ